MLEYIDLINLIAGLWLIVNSIIMETHDIKSSIIFKVIPFFIGICCLLVSLQLHALI